MKNSLFKTKGPVAISKITESTKSYKSYKSYKSSNGFSLIELMISMTIGLVITLAAISAYLGASSSSAMSQAQQRMNEDAQAAISILNQQLRMAGNNPQSNSRTAIDTAILTTVKNPVYFPTTTINGFSSSLLPSEFSFLGCDANFENTTEASDIGKLTCQGNQANQPNSIAVSYEADSFNTIPTSLAAGSLPTDCLGFPLVTNTVNFNGLGIEAPTPGSYSVAENRFYIGSSASISAPSLYCKGNGIASTAQAMVENIEDMKITYGMLSTSTPVTSIKTAQVAGYLTASQISNLPATAQAPDEASRWARVITARVCIVARSEAPVVANASSAKYVMCDGTLSPEKPDLLLRRAYTSTVVLRNRRL